MFNFIKSTLKNIFESMSSGLQKLFLAPKIDQSTLKELELILIQADTGLNTTRQIISTLQQQHAAGKLDKGSDLQQSLQRCLEDLLIKPSQALYDAQVFLFVGINGSGKTTSAAKLAHQLQQSGKKVLLVAADTFRAAAVQQLQRWADQIGVPVEKGTDNQDPASVVFTGCLRFKQEGFDCVIIDTAGRLQTKSNLMKELEKIKRIIAKQLPDAALTTLLTIDSMLGQNSLEQARIFNESTTLDGIILTKMDGTGKGGVVFAIGSELHLPVAYISFGEGISDIKPFSAHEFVTHIVQG